MTTEEEPESNKHYWRTKWSALSESYEKQRQELHELKELQSQHKTRIEKKYKEAAAASSRQYEGVCERLGEERNLVSRQVRKIEGLEKELELAQANVDSRSASKLMPMGKSRHTYIASGKHSRRRTCERQSGLH